MTQAYPPSGDPPVPPRPPRTEPVADTDAEDADRDQTGGPNQIVGGLPYPAAAGAVHDDQPGTTRPAARDGLSDAGLPEASGPGRAGYGPGLADVPAKPSYQGQPDQPAAAPRAASTGSQPPGAGESQVRKPQLQRAQVQKPQYSGSGPGTVPPGLQPSAVPPPPPGKDGPPAESSAQGQPPGGAPPGGASSPAASFSEEEKKGIRNAAFGALFLVTQADPGFMDMIKESFAASKALSGTTGVVREILTSGGMPSVPKVPASQLEQTVLPALNQAMVLVHTKDPQELDAFRGAIIGACEQVASAAGGITETETAMIQKIKGAMNL